MSLFVALEEWTLAAAPLLLFAVLGSLVVGDWRAAGRRSREMMGRVIVDDQNRVAVPIVTVNGSPVEGAPEDEQRQQR